MPSDHRETSSQTIYTYGYSGRDPEELFHVSRELDALVIDVRYRVWSRNPEWRKESLEEFLGRDFYRWIGKFGNKNYKGDQGDDVVLDDPETGYRWLKPYLDRGYSIILLCMCSSPEGCHRSNVAAFLHEKTGLPVTHLPPWQRGEPKAKKDKLPPPPSDQLELL